MLKTVKIYISIILILSLFQEIIHSQEEDLSSKNISNKIEKLKEIANNITNNANIEAGNIQNEIRNELTINNKLDTIYYLFTIGYSNYLRKNYVEALMYYLEVNEAIRSDNLDKFQAEIFFQIANSYQLLFYPKKAILYYQKAQNLEKELNEDNIRLHRIILDIGNAYYAMKEYAKSLNYYQEALESSIRTQDSLSIVLSLINIGNLYRVKKEYKRANKVTNNALQMSLKLNLDHLVNMSLFNLGEIYFDLENLDLSISYFKKSLLEMNKHELTSIIPKAFKYLIIIYYEKKQYRKSLDYCKQFHEVANKYDIQTQLLRSVKEINEILIELQSFPEAPLLLNKNLQLLDTILVFEIDSKRKLTESLHKLSELEGNYEILEKENIIKEKKLRQSQILIGSTILVLLLLSFLLFISIKSKNKINRKNLIIKSQFEEIKNINKEVIAKSEEISAQSEEIKLQNDKLANYQNHLEKTIDERTNELKIALVKAQESDNLKTAFLQNISHEIRTPLNAINGFSQLLSISDNTKSEYAEIINKNVNDLTGIIDNIIMYSKLQSGQLAVNIKQTNIPELINSFEKEVRYNHIKLRENTLNFQLKYKLDNVNNIQTDVGLLKKVLTHIVENSIKYTEKGSIIINCLQEFDNLKFIISDTGIGIKKEELPFVFDSFKKIEGSKKLFRGTGIGLSLVKQVIELLNGKISIESEYGKGTKVNLLLPLKYD